MYMYISKVTKIIANNNSPNYPKTKGKILLPSQNHANYPVIIIYVGRIFLRRRQK